MTEGFYTQSAYKSSEIDTWSTPLAFYHKINAEFNFGLDAAALQSSTLVPDNWYGPDHPDTNRKNAFLRNWVADASGKTIWLNPPYGRTIKEWTAKANLENRRGGLSFASSGAHRYFMVARALHYARSTIYSRQIKVWAKR